MRALLASLVVIVFSLPVFSQSVAEKQKEFDFWIGEWDVNLRVKQKDLSWKDQHKSVARIYSILDGKAILELWSENEAGINGYSLRYYNPKKKSWDLWLNWAGKNRSGTNGMECKFRHKRAECFSKRKTGATTNLISRFTFSDAQPNSVRWDDAYSRDEGKTWSNNWIMEFSRRKQKPPLLESTPNPLTYFNGNRCNTPQFNLLKQLVANQKKGAKLKLYNILDGCIVAGFINHKKGKAFFTLTYNTFAKAYEFAFLNSDNESALGLYYGNKTANGFEFQTRAIKNVSPSKASIKSSATIKSIEIKYHGKKLGFDF